MADVDRQLGIDKIGFCAIPADLPDNEDTVDEIDTTDRAMSANKQTPAESTLTAAPVDTITRTPPGTAKDTAAPSMRKTLTPVRRNESIGSMIQRSIVQHQLGISLNLILLLTLTYTFFPSLRPRLSPFFQLQHPYRGTYQQGPQDIWLVLGCIVVFTGLRAFLMDYALGPLGKKLGVKKGKMQQRFAEQSYMMIYYGFFWSLGLALFIRGTPVINETGLAYIRELLSSLWEGFPNLGLKSTMKWYYLAQIAFWFQQVIVIHLEERRSDHWQMLTHHFVTLALLIFSYSFYTTRGGAGILVLMDTVDLIFPFAKCLRYVGLQTACDLCFGLFVVSWIISRHIIYGAVLWSMFTQNGFTSMMYGTYDLRDGTRISTYGGTNVLDNLLQSLLNPEAETVSYNPRTRWVFLSLLSGLQLIICVWFVMIMRVVLRVLSGQSAEDDRSDDEVEAEQEEEVVEEKYIEVTAEADELYLPKQRIIRKSKGISSGLNLGEHKEILNRIGCLSEEQLARERERRRQSSPQPGSSKHV